MQAARRILKYATGTGIVSSAIYFAYKNDWTLSNVGMVRFGRTAVCAGFVVLDYKKSLAGIDSSSNLYSRIKSEVHTRSAERLCDVAFINGGVFIKVGQHLGALEYLIPPEYVEVFKVMHSSAPQSSLSDVYRVIREDLGREPEELFSTFEPRPIGTASLAQVHKAKLHDGSVVAVKVQHRMVKARSRIDMKTMEVLVNVVSWIFPEFKFQWLVDETKRNLPLELDFVCEGNNAERVARMLKQFSFLKVPKIVWDLTTERVLTMEFCDGGQVNDKDYIKKHDICITEVTKNLSKMYSEMIFVQGYVHSDPHPGNVLVKKTPQGTQIVLLDHGLYATLTSYFRVNYSKLWLSLIASDVEKIQKYATRLGVGDLYRLLSCMITARSWKSISSGISKQVTAEENAEIQQMAALYLPQITDVLSRVSREMLLILKANDLLRGIEYSHGIQASTGYFLTMARHCVRAVYEWRHHQCGSRWCRVRVACAKHWTLLRIDIYELLLRWSDSALIVWLTSRFAVA